jgi:hypothetical protein
MATHVCEITTLKLEAGKKYKIVLERWIHVTRKFSLSGQGLSRN